MISSQKTSWENVYKTLKKKPYNIILKAFIGISRVWLLHYVIFLLSKSRAICLLWEFLFFYGVNCFIGQIYYSIIYQFLIDSAIFLGNTYKTNVLELTLLATKKDNTYYNFFTSLGLILLLFKELNLLKFPDTVHYLTVLIIYVSVPSWQSPIYFFLIS